MNSQPDETGKFGKYGGRFAPEVLMSALEELERAFRKFHADKGFNEELNYLLRWMFQAVLKTLQAGKTRQRFVSSSPQ